MKRTRAALALTVLLWPAIALGSDEISVSDAISGGTVTVVDGSTPDTWGTQNTYIALGAWDAHPIDSSVTYDLIQPAGQGITRTGGNSWFKAPVHVPNGALVTKIEVNFCDTGAGSFAAHFFTQPKNAVPVVIPSVVSSGGGATPGCVVQTGVFGTPVAVDNGANSYNIELYMNSTDNSIVFLSARVGYTLQVSPAPAVATFTDVPTSHPFFRFVEALAAAGITGGCGSGLYCPDNPVTRGQMAVFLSISLGLHFPN
jgi:hypothetical protein